MTTAHKITGTPTTNHTIDAGIVVIDDTLIDIIEEASEAIHLTRLIAARGYDVLIQRDSETQHLAEVAIRRRSDNKKLALPCPPTGSGITHQLATFAYIDLAMM